jgi:P-type conjugative transfer protein TrbL
MSRGRRSSHVCARVGPGRDGLTQRWPLPRGTTAGDAVASVLLTAVKMGVFYWLLVNLSPLATAAYQTFLQWGMTPTAGAFSNETFLQPASMINLGFAIAGDIHDMGQRLSIWSRLNHPFLLWGYSIAYFLILLAFAFVALHLMMTIIEYHMAVLVSVVLIPWGVLRPTAFFTEFSIGWITGGVVWVLVTGALVGIATPLFRDIAPTMTAGGDPTAPSSLIVAIASVIFALLAWVVPGRVASIAGRGVSLALHGGALLAAAAGPLRGVVLVSAAIRGVSSLLRR